jgi:hypothetical protein
VDEGVVEYEELAVNMLSECMENVKWVMEYYLKEK